MTGTVIGQHRRMNNGNIMNNFGGASHAEVTPEGELVWSMSTELGHWLGNGQGLMTFMRRIEMFGFAMGCVADSAEIALSDSQLPVRSPS